MPNISDQSDEIDDNELGNIVSMSPSLPSINSDDAECFAIEVRRLLERRASQEWPSENSMVDLAAFVFVSYPRMIAEKLNAQSVIDLPDLHLPVFGRIFFLTKDASNGSYLDLPCEESNTLNWLEDNGFDGCPLVIARRGTMKVSIRKAGVLGTTTHELIRNKPPLLTAEELELALEHFYKDNLVTPSQCESGIWEPGRAHEYVPVKLVEKAIQNRLRTSLSGWFRGVLRVELEDPVPAGRIDVRILAPSPGAAGLQYWAIIELKVARSFHNAPAGKVLKPVPKSRNAKDVAGGISQALAFSSIRNLEEGYLEVFDMRKDKSFDLLTDTIVKIELDKCAGKVKCRIRPMFGSSREARENGVLL